MSDAEYLTPDVPAQDRTTAPQSPYTTRHVAIGFVVLAVGLAIAFGLGLVLT